MLINVTSTEQTVYIFISDGGASVIVGDRCIGSPKGGWRVGRWSTGKVLGYSCIFDTFCDNLKATDLVYFIS